MLCTVLGGKQDAMIGLKNRHPVLLKSTLVWYQMLEADRTDTIGKIAINPT